MEGKIKGKQETRNIRGAPNTPHTHTHKIERERE